MMITKDDIIKILEDNYKSSFDETSMETFNNLMPICVCACESNVRVKDGEFLAATVKCIGIGWAIHALRIKDSAATTRFEGLDRVRAFLAFAGKLRRRGFHHLDEAEHIIRAHLTDI